MHGASMREINVLHVILVPIGSPCDSSCRCIDTAVRSPDDICTWETAPIVGEASYLVLPRSVVLLALALDRATESTPQMD